MTNNADQKPTDLDLNCLQRQNIIGTSSTSGQKPIKALTFLGENYLKKKKKKKKNIM